MAGRPRSFDRDAALACALTAFWEQGYAGTSISHLTSAMGIAPPSLYAAFGDKRALFDEAAARYLQALGAAMDVGLAKPTARAAVEHLLRAAAAHYTSSGHPHGCLVMSEPRLADARESNRVAIRDRIRRGAEEGELAPGSDPDALAAFVDVVLTGMAARSRDGASHDELRATVDRAMAAWPPDPGGDGIRAA